ncbi:MAG TPA: hypothetical protein DCS60_07735 [Opitutae bacterium]|nr:hypothetical protein [Opitutae bacterium]
MEALVECFRMRAELNFIKDNTPYDKWVRAIPTAQPVKDGVLKALSEMPSRVQTISKFKKRTC